MRKAGWPCLSAGTPRAESRNSSPMASEPQGPGLTSVLGTGLPEAPGPAVARGRGAGTGLCCALPQLPAGRPTGRGNSSHEGSGTKALLQLCQVYVSPGGSISLSIREAAGAVLGLLLRLQSSLCCSRSRINLAWCLDFSSSAAPLGISSPCAGGSCNILPLSRLGTTGKMQHPRSVLVMTVMEESLIP